MNQTDANDSLATIVGDALRIDAARGPELPDTWSDADADLVPAIPLDARRPRRLVLAAGLTAAAASLAAIAMVAPSPFSINESATEVGEWLPAGTEFPSTDLGPATSVPDGPAVEDLTRRIGIDGHPDQIVARSMTYHLGETAVEFFCTWENGGGGCRPASLPVSWSIGISSSIDSWNAETDLWLLEGLPETVAFVSYSTAEQQLWQRPVFGFVAFPYTSSDPVVIGYDLTGAEVGRYSDENHFELVQTYVFPLQADLTEAEQIELSDLTRHTMTSCLAEAGGQVGPGGVATFADDVDQGAVWDSCVAAVEAAVAARVAEIGPDMHPPGAGPVSEQGETLTTVTVLQD